MCAECIPTKFGTCDNVQGLFHLVYLEYEVFCMATSQ